MANRSLTARCTQVSRNRLASPPLEPATFLDTLDQLHRAGLRELSLPRGEPATHPDFAWMLTRALERGFRLLIATSGRMPHAIVRKLERLPPEKARVLVQVALPGESSPAERERQVNLFRRLGPRVLLGLEVHSPAVRFDYLLDLIDRHGLARRVRLDLACPTPEGDDHGSRHVAAIAEAARAAGVQLELGCGFEEGMIPPSESPPVPMTSPLPFVMFSKFPAGPSPAGVTLWAIPRD